MSLVRNTLVQASLTLASRVLGFVRDILLNARFGGQSAALDIWATALMFPNLFRRLFAEGAFSQAFVPVYGKLRAEDGAQAADHAASQTMSTLLAVVAAFCVVMQFAMGWLAPLLLSGYRDDLEAIGIATIALQLTMPYLACMTLASLLAGVANTAGRFALSAALPTLLNVFTIAPLLLVPGETNALLVTCAAVTASGVAQAYLLWRGVRNLGARLRFGWPTLSAPVRRIVALAIPGALAGGALQINSLVSQVLAGASPGARAVLYNADRLYQLPLGLVGVAIGLALVPRLTRAFVEGDENGARGATDDGLGLAMAFTLPAAVALFTIPFFIIDATFTRGEFDSEDARRTAEVLRHFAWGVPAFVLARILTAPFFARQNTAFPMRAALIAVALNTALATGLFLGLGQIGVDGVIGIAIASSLASWLNVTLLLRRLAADGAYRVGPELRARLLKLAVPLAFLAATLWLCQTQYATLSALFWRKELAILVVCFVGFAVYAFSALAFRAVTLREIRAALRREPAPAGVRLSDAGE